MALEKYADGNVPKGILLLHKTDIDKRSFQAEVPLPLAFDFYSIAMQHSKVKKSAIDGGVEIATAVPAGRKEYCHTAGGLEKKFSEIYSGPAVRYSWVAAGDMAHSHHQASRDVLLNDFMALLETARRENYPVYYYDSTELIEIDIRDLSCEEEGLCIDAVNRYFTNLYSNELEKQREIETKAAAEQAECLSKIEPNSLLALNMMLSSLPDKC